MSLAKIKPVFRRQILMFNHIITASFILVATVIPGMSQIAVADNDDIDLDNPNTPASLKYGKECAEKLGSLPPFSCLDGKILPITVNGQEVHEAVDKCDKPIYLGVGPGGRCKPNARLGRLDTGNPDVDTVFICRRYQNVTDPLQPGFSDVAVVQHNRVTGDTCFFQALGNENLYGRRVPPPNEVRVPDDVRAEHPQASDSVNFWKSPQLMGGGGLKCVRCHDSDPFIHTPYVDQVFLDDARKTKMVPEDAFGPYNIIATKYGMNTWPESFSVKTTATGNGNCTSCHRIGSQSTCGEFAGDSVGAGAEFGSQVEPYKTAWAKEWSNARWMAPHGTYANRTQWEHFVKPSADDLLRCCRLVNARRGGINSTLSTSAITEIEASGCKLDPISHNIP
jgi:hypothetical protein